MAREPRNVGASVRARLLDKARAEKTDFQILLTCYALERLLYGDHEEVCYSDPMITKTPDRIVELWPHLSETARADLIARAETVAAQPDTFTFTPEELAGIERGRQDFKHGRTLTTDQFESNMDTFMTGLRQKASRAS